MRFLRLSLVFLILFNFSCSSIGGHSRLPSSENEYSKYRLPRVDKSDFNKRLERELIKQVEILDKKLTEPEQKALQKIRKKAYKILIDLNPWDHIKHMLIEHGKGAAITAAVTEIITVGIMPALLTAAGLPGAALLSASFPSFSITVPAYIFWKNARQKKKLAKELGFNSLKELDRLKKEILGFCTSTRLVSKIYEGVEGEVEINIVKRRFSKWRESPTGNLVDLYDLEKIAKEGLDKKVLEIIKPLAKEDPAVYATVLVDQISKRPNTNKKLSDLIKKQVSELAFELTDHQQTMLLLVHEKETFLRNLKIKVRKYKSSLLKEVKELENAGESKKVVNSFMENILSDLELLELDLKRFEYGFLHRLQNGESISSVDVDDISNNLSERMSRARFDLTRFESRIKEIGNTFDLNELRRMVKDMKIANLSWKPFNIKMDSDSSCVGMVARFLSNSKVSIQ
ncbi:MAG: hypothetical protein CME70_14755 [Halobacteriovorax sp.]|nr:hypothetical protein [Halobacteriovorax sp.]|tara:strand:+ start:181191 stop:182561 length:1371 start_codon:yes stop_codon:yes gene_type:complete